MMPNSWLYKLKNKKRRKANSAANPALLPHRPSLYFSGGAQAERPACPRTSPQPGHLGRAGCGLKPPAHGGDGDGRGGERELEEAAVPGVAPAADPRLASRRAPVGQRGARRGPSVATRGVAAVKASADPHRDFRESMVKMIVENGIHAPGDLEELLACYLSLNSDEYHGVIVKAFEQIWFGLGGVDP